MGNFGLLIRALPGILLSFAILLGVIAIVVKVTSGRWPSISMLSDGDLNDTKSSKNGNRQKS